MDLKNLLTFKTILETGSFQEAARKLNYAQSTVTTQIQQLEQELQVKLFDKIGRKMLLTSAGSDLLPSVNQILETYNTMKTIQIMRS
ncbi:LysR family transcriptional regulator [Listeria monocytogenes]